MFAERLTCLRMSEEQVKRSQSEEEDEQDGFMLQISALKRRRVIYSK